MQLLANGRQQFIDQNGAPLANGLVYLYAPGTTTPQTTYQDSAGTIQNTNPIRLDSSGQATIWASGNFRQVVTDASGVVLWDQIAGAPDALTNLAAATGASLVGFRQAGTGAVSRTAQDKLRESVSVKDFGAKGDGTTDDSAAFQAAVNALPALGGRIDVPDAPYMLSAQPSWNTKSIYWNIGSGATFSGAGTGQGLFPYMNTNNAQLAVGPFIQSQSRQKSTNANGGTAAFNVEMLQPSDLGAAQSVAIYAGARTANPNTGGNVWAINALVAADTGSLGTIQGIEVDVNCSSAAALVKGIALSGTGSQNPDVGVEISRLPGTLWDRGVHVMGSTIGLRIDMGINGGDCVVMTRKADTSETGYFMRCTNAANTSNLVLLDVDGNFTTSGSVTAGALKITGGAASMPAGQICIGNTTATAASAGAASALPATPDGYLLFFLGSAVKRIPYYN